VRHVRQSRRWRQTLFALCLPYLLASVLVDFVHVHRQPVATASALAGEVGVTAPRQAPRPDNPCTACLWLRTGLQLTPHAAATLAAGVATTAFVLPPDAVRPDTPAAPSTLLRAPPSTLLG